MTDEAVESTGVVAITGSINSYQLRVMLRLANLDQKVYAAFTGDERANQMFNDVCQLVQLRLVTDVSNTKDFRKMVADSEADGEQMIVVQITNRGQWMFEECPWDKWKN